MYFGERIYKIYLINYSEFKLFMIKKIKFYVFIISLIFSNVSFANTFQELYDNGLKAIKKGGNVIFLRHAYAPRTVENGNHDKNYKDKVCSTQRDILKEGIRQSKDIGNFVTKNNIKIDKVISSFGINFWIFGFFMKFCYDCTNSARTQQTRAGL